MLLIGYLYGITSERKLCEELKIEEYGSCSMEMKPKEYIKRVEKENPVEEPWEPDDDFKHKPKHKPFVDLLLELLRILGSN